MSRRFGLMLIAAGFVLVGCNAHKRCDGPNGSCGHPWCDKHPWFGKRQQPTYPIGAPAAGAAVEAPPPGAVYTPPGLQSAPAFGPTPDVNAPAVAPTIR